MKRAKKGRGLRARYGHAGGRAKKAAPDPKVYLSFSEGTYRVIHQGVPISANKPTAREALQVAEHFKLKVSDRVWLGDSGQWGSL